MKRRCYYAILAIMASFGKKKKKKKECEQYKQVLNNNKNQWDIKKNMIALKM